MWSRVVEIMLGCWMLVSPFVYRYSAGAVDRWIHDFAAGSALILFGVLSFCRSTRYLHLASAVVGAAMVAFAFLTHADPVDPALQNAAAVGLLAMMFAIIPNEAARPPESWRRECVPQTRDP